MAAPRKGRPQIGRPRKPDDQKTVVVNLSLPPAILAHLDHLAFLHQMTRSRMVQELVLAWLRTLKALRLSGPPAPPDPSNSV